MSSRNKKVSELSEDVAKHLLNDYLEKGEIYDANILKEIKRLNTLIKSSDDISFAGKTLTDFYKMMIDNNNRKKSVADSLLDYAKHKQKLDLDERKFQDKRKGTKDDEDEKQGLSDDIKDEIKEILGNKK